MNKDKRYKARSLPVLGWPEVLISSSISLALCHSVPRHYTSILDVGGLVLRARECVSLAEAVPNHSLVTGRLAPKRIWTFCLGGDRITPKPPGRLWTKSVPKIQNIRKTFFSWLSEISKEGGVAVKLKIMSIKICWFLGNPPYL